MANPETVMVGDPVWVRANVTEVGQRRIGVRLVADHGLPRVEARVKRADVVLAPESTEKLLAAIREWAEVAKDLDEFDGDCRGILQALREREVALAALVGIELEAGEG